MANRKLSLKKQTFCFQILIFLICFSCAIIQIEFNFLRSSELKSKSRNQNVSACLGTKKQTNKAVKLFFFPLRKPSETEYIIHNPSCCKNPTFSPNFISLSSIDLKITDLSLSAQKAVK